MQIDAGRVSYFTSSSNLAQRRNCTYRCSRICKLSFEGFICRKKACDGIGSSWHPTNVFRLHETSDYTSKACTKVQSFLCYTLAREAEGVVEVFNHTKENVGVLLLNLGGPETLEDVQPFLYNLFADPDIIRLPRLLRFLQQPLAKFISMMRAPKSMEGYASIGGGSPLRRITEEQANALRVALEEKSIPAKVYIGMRYWHPFTEEAIRQERMM